jgi:recombination protein RecA
MMQKKEKRWDVFICHSSEDKVDFVRPLADLLSSEGLAVWYDEFSLKLGDSLRRSIDLGLKYSDYGLVILSPSFFNKEWPQKELDGLAAKENDGSKVILPIWHNVKRNDVVEYSPILSDKIAVSSESGLENVVSSILQAVRNASDKKVIQIPARKEIPSKKRRAINVNSKLNTISTGIIKLDHALGYGGWPLGHLVEIISPSGAGKTSLLLSSAYQFQKDGAKVLFIDSDYGIETPALHRFGIKKSNIILKQSSSFENIHELIISFLSKNSKSLIIIDSIASVIYEKYIDSSLGENYEKDTRFRQLMIDFVRTTKPLLKKKKSVMLISNQIVEKVGIMFGNPETTPWETLSLVDASSIRVDLRKISLLRSGAEIVGQRTKVKILKNKIASPFRNIEFNIYFSEGINTNDCLFEFAEDMKLIRKNGIYYKFKNRPIGDSSTKGREMAMKAFFSNQEFVNELNADILNIYKTRT